MRAVRNFCDEWAGQVPKVVEVRHEDFMAGTHIKAIPRDDPSFKGQKKQAWTQPVGWELRPAAKQ